MLAEASGEKEGRWDSPVFFFCLEPPAEGVFLAKSSVELGFVLGFCFPFCFFLASFEASFFGGGDGFVSAVLYSDCSEALSAVGKITF